MDILRGCSFLITFGVICSQEHYELNITTFDFDKYTSVSDMNSSGYTQPFRVNVATQDLRISHIFPPLRVSSSGFISNIRLLTAVSGELRLQIWRKMTDGFQLKSTRALRTQNLNNTQDFPENISVEAGDLLGFWVPTSTYPVAVINCRLNTSSPNCRKTVSIWNQDKTEPMVNDILSKNNATITYDAHLLPALLFTVLSQDSQALNETTSLPEDDYDTYAQVTGNIQDTTVKDQNSGIAPEIKDTTSFKLSTTAPTASKVVADVTGPSVTAETTIIAGSAAKNGTVGAGDQVMESWKLAVIIIGAALFGSLVIAAAVLCNRCKMKRQAKKLEELARSYEASKHIYADADPYSEVSRGFYANSLGESSRGIYAEPPGESYGFSHDNIGFIDEPAYAQISKVHRQPIYPYGDNMVPYNDTHRRTVSPHGEIVFMEPNDLYEAAQYPTSAMHDKRVQLFDNELYTKC